MRTNPTAPASNSGFTLLEGTLALTVSLVSVAALYAIGTGIFRSTSSHDSFILIRQESRIAMQHIVDNLRVAQSASIRTQGPLGIAPLGTEPTTRLQFRRVIDADANAVALNQDMTVGLSEPLTYALDLDDANGDGISETQLVQLRSDGSVAKVLTNNVSPVVDTDDFYDTPLGGLVFEDVGEGSIQVTLILRHRPSPNARYMVTRLDEIVAPRN